MVTSLESWNDWKDACFPLVQSNKGNRYRTSCFTARQLFIVPCEGIHNNPDNGNLSEATYTDV